jgi:hypothetical protein
VCGSHVKSYLLDDLQLQIADVEIMRNEYLGKRNGHVRQFSAIAA